MKTGFSLLLSEYIGSESLDYKDCEFFQIVCPCCKEAVFKVCRNENIKPLTYLSHYEKSKSYASECELRVSNIKSDDIIKYNSNARNQKLEYFLSVLQDAVLNNEYSGDINRLKNYFSRLDKSKALSINKEYFFDTIRNDVFCDKDHVYTLFEDYISDITKISGSFIHTELAISTQKSIAFDIFLHLRALNSQNSLNFMFNHAYTFLITRFESKKFYQPYEKYLLESMRKLPDLSKEKGMSLLYDLSEYQVAGYQGDKSNLHTKMNAEVCHELLGTLLRLPYFTLLKQATFNKLRQVL